MRAGGPLVAQVGGVLGLRIVSLLASLVASILAARALGPALRGELAVMIALPALVAAVALLGLDMANMSFAGRTPTSHTTVARYSLAYAAIMGAGLVLAGLVGSSAFPAIRLGLDPAPFAAAIALTPMLLATALLSASEAGRGRAVRVAGATALATAGYAAAIVVVTALRLASPDALFIGFALSQVLLGAFLLLSSAPCGRSETPGAVPLREYVAFGLRADLAAIAMLLLLRIDVPMIQLLAGPREVGVYATALPMAEALLLLPTAVTLFVAPRTARGQMDAEQAARVAAATLLLTLAGGVVLAAAAPLVIPALFGQAFEAATPVLWVLLPGVVLLASSRILQVHLIAGGRFRFATFAAVAALAVCVVLELLLVPRLGAMGAAAASSVAYLVFAVAMATRMRAGLRSLTGVPLRPAALARHLVERAASIVRGLRSGGPVE